MSCFRNAIYMARDLKSLLFPAQFADAMRSRDFDAAAGRAADAVGVPAGAEWLTNKEAEEDVAEPAPGPEPCPPGCDNKQFHLSPCGKWYVGHNFVIGSGEMYEREVEISAPVDQGVVEITASPLPFPATSKPVNHHPELPGAWGGDCEYCDTGKPHPGGPKVSASPADTSAVPHADTGPVAVPPAATGSPPNFRHAAQVLDNAAEVIEGGVGEPSSPRRKAALRIASKCRELAKEFDKVSNP